MVASSTWFLSDLCSRYSTDLYTTWMENVNETSQYNLGLPLISRDSVTRLISVNFNQQVYLFISFLGPACLKIWDPKSILSFFFFPFPGIFSTMYSIIHMCLFLYNVSICFTFGQLTSVLREVKYLESRQTEAIPETAMQIYTSRVQLWQYVTNLEMTVGRYNKVITRLMLALAH